MKSKWIQLVVLLFAVFFLRSSHGCRLSSPLIEGLILITVLSLFSVLILKAKSQKKAWLYLLISLALAVAIDTAYLGWLHSDSFPEALLSEGGVQYKRKKELILQQVKEAEARIEIMEQQAKEKEAQPTN